MIDNLDLCYKISLVFIFALITLLLINKLLNRNENFAKLHKQKEDKKKVVKFVRVRVADDEQSTCIQVAQLAVYDEKNRNVALNRPVQYHPDIWPTSRPELATDGTMSNRDFPYIFHDYPCTGNQNGNHMEIELQDKTHVTRVTYYNRRDCCSDRATHLVVELLDENRNLVAKEKIYSPGAMLDLFFNY